MLVFIRNIILIYILTTSLLFSHSTKKKALKSHEHGVGTLNISQDKETLMFEFEIPGQDIVGFEYEAKTEEDIKKVEESIKILSNYKNMLLPSGSAKCVLESSSAKVINEGKHSEFLSNYKFNCKNINKLKVIYIKFFNSFKAGEKLNIKIFGSNKKSTYVINKNKKILIVKEHF